MVVGFFDAWMAAVVVEADVIDVAAGRCQVSKILLRIHVFQRHHVDGADQVPPVVIGEERTFRQCLWVDIECAETGAKLGNLKSVLIFSNAAGGSLRTLAAEAGSATSIAATKIAEALTSMILSFHSCWMTLPLTHASQLSRWSRRTGVLLSSACPSAGRYRPKFNSKSLGTP